MEFKPFECQHLARNYFAAPTSSAYSERLFSEALNFYKQKRNRLLAKTGEKLYFSTTT